MAQNTLLAPPITSALQSWIAANVDAINLTAAKLGISPTSIALAVAEEGSFKLRPWSGLAAYGGTNATLEMR
jgi:hypothetical protein